MGWFDFAISVLAFASQGAEKSEERVAVFLAELSKDDGKSCIQNILGGRSDAAHVLMIQIASAVFLLNAHQDFKELAVSQEALDFLLHIRISSTKVLTGLLNGFDLQKVVQGMIAIGMAKTVIFFLDIIFSFKLTSISFFPPEGG